MLKKTIGTLVILMALAFFFVPGQAMAHWKDRGWHHGWNHGRHLGWYQNRWERPFVYAPPVYRYRYVPPAPRVVYDYDGYYAPRTRVYGSVRSPLLDFRAYDYDY